MRVVALRAHTPAGALSLAEWDALRGSTAVVCSDPSHPHARAIADAGVDVLPRDTVEDALVLLLPGEQSPAGVEVVAGAAAVPGSQLLEVVAVMARLRRECPWTRQQTHASLAHYLLEETYEALEALDTDDSVLLREELGDLLMQVVFHAVIASESEGWDVDDVAAGIAAKLVHRNPHVFGDVTVADAAEVDANWQALKALEKERTSPLDGVPAQLPALAWADKVLGRLGDVAIEGDDPGSRLLRVVRETRAAGVDAEQSLRQAVRSLIEPR